MRLGRPSIVQTSFPASPRIPGIHRPHRATPTTAIFTPGTVVGAAAQEPDYRRRMELGRIGVWSGAFAVTPAADAQSCRAGDGAAGYDTLWYSGGPRHARVVHERRRPARRDGADPRRIGYREHLGGRSLGGERRARPRRRVRRPVPARAGRQPPAPGRSAGSHLFEAGGDHARLPRGAGRRPVRQPGRPGRATACSARHRRAPPADARLAGAKALGAHSYLVPPEHSRAASSWVPTAP